MTTGLLMLALVLIVMWVSVSIMFYYQRQMNAMLTQAICALRKTLDDHGIYD